MIPLVAPCITGRDRGYMRQRIADGLLQDESEVRVFEEAFAARVGCAGAVAVCSGTVALELALEALDVGAVSIPTYTCVAVREAVCTRVRSYLDSGFDVRSATAWTEEGRGPVVLTHMFGTETDYAGIPAIEDWTLSFGYTPSLHSALGVCSTHASKMLSTGRGGVVFGDGALVLAQVRKLADAESLNMSSTQAALGVSQLAQLDSFIERRREIAHIYSLRFAVAGIEYPLSDCGSVFFRYLIRVTDPADKIAQLAEHGIEAGRGVYPPLHRLAGLSDDRFPGATECVNTLLSVPCHPSITDAQAEFIAEKVVEMCA